MCFNKTIQVQLLNVLFNASGAICSKPTRTQHVEYMFFDGFDTSTLTFDASSHVRKQKRKHVEA